MPSFRAPSKLANSTRTKDVANAFHRHRQGLCRNQPKCGMRRWVRSSPCSVGLPGVPQCSHGHRARPWKHCTALLWDLHLPCCPRSSCAASTPSSSWWSSSSTIPAQQGSPGTCTWAEAASTTHKGTADNPTLSCLSVELLPSHSRHKIPLRAERRTGALCQGSVFLMGAAPQPQHLHQALTHTRLFI